MSGNRRPITRYANAFATNAVTTRYEPFYRGPDSTSRRAVRNLAPAVRRSDTRRPCPGRGRRPRPPHRRPCHAVVTHGEDPGNLLVERGIPRTQDPIWQDFSRHAVGHARI